MFKKKNFLFALSFLFFNLISVHLFAASDEISVNLLDKSELLGMTVFWDPMAGSGIIEKNGHQISFTEGQEFVLQDYKTFLPEKAPVLKDGSLMVSEKFLVSIENYFKTESDLSTYKIGAILIDPGHGGKDPGANAVHVINGKKVNVVEKNINLSVGLKLYDFLKKSYPDKNILMTRKTDVFLSLQQRTEIANSVKLKDNEAILYVSIHVNASMDKNARGYEVWYLSPGYRRQVLKSNQVEDQSLLPILNSMMEEEYTTESILIAKFIIDALQTQVGNLTTSRGIKAEEWYVCRNSNMPSVLVETGFLTNPVEGPLLADDKYLQKLAFGIYNGLEAFITHFERSRGFTGVK